MRVVAPVIESQEPGTKALELAIEERAVRGVSRDSIRVLRYYHAYAASFYQVSYSVQTGTFQISPAPTFVADLFQDLVALLSGPFPQGSDLLVETVAANLIVAGDAGVEDGLLRIVTVGGGHDLVLRFDDPSRFLSEGMS